jgi:hypothetical protein
MILKQIISDEKIDFILHFKTNNFKTTFQLVISTKVQGQFSALRLLLAMWSQWSMTAVVDFINMLHQGILTEGDGAVQLTSSLR